MTVRNDTDHLRIFPLPIEKMKMLGVSFSLFSESDTTDVSLKQFKRAFAGSAVADGREPKSCLFRVFNSKLGRIAAVLIKC
jgi:hypothetical protein